MKIMILKKQHKYSGKDFINNLKIYFMKELDLKILSKFKSLMENRPTYVNTGYQPNLFYIGDDPDNKYSGYNIMLQYCDPEVKNELNIEPQDDRCDGANIWHTDYNTMHYKKMFTLQTPSNAKYCVKFKSNSEFDDYVDKFEMFMTDALMDELD